MKFPFNTFRIIGSAFLIIGYFMMLNVNVLWGVSIRLVANGICLPWALKNKLWDFAILLGFFMTIEFHKLLQLLTNS